MNAWNLSLAQISLAVNTATAYRNTATTQQPSTTKQVYQQSLIDPRDKIVL